MSLYGVGETFHYGFSTYNSSNALANADSTPTGTLVVNGTDSGAAVTITNPATGRYSVAASLAGRSIGDDCFVRVSATVGGVTEEYRLPLIRVAFPGALSGGILTAGVGTGQLSVAAGVGNANVVQFNGTAVGTSDGTMQAGSTSTTAVLAATASSINDTYNGRVLTIVAGTGAGQSRVIGTAAGSYVGATRTATISPAWVTTPDATSQYAMDPAGGSSGSGSFPSAAPANWITASAFAAGVLPANFSTLAIETTTGRVDVAALRGVALTAASAGNFQVFYHDAGGTTTRIVDNVGSGAGSFPATAPANWLTISSFATGVQPADFAGVMLDLPAGVEPGETVRQFFRRMRAIHSGLTVIGTGGAVSFLRRDGTTTAVTITADRTGHRTSVVDGTL
jgi:hypothetical protein